MNPRLRGNNGPKYAFADSRAAISAHGQRIRDSNMETLSCATRAGPRGGQSAQADFGEL